LRNDGGYGGYGGWLNDVDRWWMEIGWCCFLAWLEYAWRTWRLIH
jgi:hypothetical protein